MERKKTQFIKPRFNVLFSVCVDWTNNDSQTALAKDVTETDVGQAESETLSSLSICLFRALCRGKRSVQSKSLYCVQICSFVWHICWLVFYQLDIS